MTHITFYTFETYYPKIRSIQSGNIALQILLSMAQRITSINFSGLPLAQGGSCTSLITSPSWLVPNTNLFEFFKNAGLQYHSGVNSFTSDADVPVLKDFKPRKLDMMNTFRSEISNHTHHVSHVLLTLQNNLSATSK